jgi:hypothetical protein
VPFTPPFAQNIELKARYGRQDCTDLAPLVREFKVIECAKWFLKYNRNYVNDYHGLKKEFIEKEIDDNCCIVNKGSFHRGAELGIHMEYIDKYYRKRSISIDLERDGNITNIYQENF